MKTYKQLYDENGEYRLDESYTEILKLDKMLTDANIPHTLNRFFDGWQVVYSVNGTRISDAIQHFGSYGNTANLLEIMGLVKPEETSDSVLGHLTADDVFARISEHYKSHQPRKEDSNMVDKSTPKHPSYNSQRGMLCPNCDYALWNRVEIKSVFGTKKITVKEQPNFCKNCGQALKYAYTES